MKEEVMTKECMPHICYKPIEHHAYRAKKCDENRYGLIRQYIPNGTDFKNVSQQRIKMIQRIINSRPRGKLNLLTPDGVVYKKTS